MLRRAAQLCQHGSTALAPPSTGGKLSLGAGPDGSWGHRYLEFGFSRKGAIPLQPSPKALCREAAFKIEKAQVGEQLQAGPECGGTCSQKCPGCVEGPSPMVPAQPPCALQGS